MTTTTSPRTYEVRTYGCQMNAHDSERMAGLLEAAGYVMIPEQHRLPFDDCGVRIETTPNRKTWAPSWAVLIVDHLYGSTALPAVLCRAARTGR